MIYGPIKTVQDLKNLHNQDEKCVGVNRSKELFTLEKNAPKKISAEAAAKILDLTVEQVERIRTTEGAIAPEEFRTADTPAEHTEEDLPFPADEDEDTQEEYEEEQDRKEPPLRIVDVIRKQIEEVENAIESLREKAENNQEDIEELQDAVETLKEDLEEVKKTHEENSETIATLKEAVEELTKQLDVYKD